MLNESLIAFILELDKLKAVTRKVKPLGVDRYENPAEHTWQIALAAIALADYAAEPVTMSRVVPMLLVHDIGEIDTGDTIAFDLNGLAERKAAERAAVTRIVGLAGEPRASEWLALWEEFEREETPDAKFANAIDRAMPVLLNLNNHGQSWRENGITYARVVARVGPQIRAGCPALWTYLETRLADAHGNGWFGIST